MKDHQKRELLDKLTATAVEFAGQQQLRLQLQSVLFPALDEMCEDTLSSNNASWQMLVSKTLLGVVGTMVAYGSFFTAAALLLCVTISAILRKVVRTA